jgi:hypothetical protein
MRFVPVSRGVRALDRLGIVKFNDLPVARSPPGARICVPIGPDYRIAPDETHAVAAR